MDKMKVWNCGRDGELAVAGLEGKVGFMKEGNEEKERLGLKWEEFVKKGFESLKAKFRLR